MKKLLTSVFILITVCTQAQKDTLEYQGIKFYKGDTVHLWYGSKPDKSFAFIQIGSMVTGVTDLNKEWAKHDVIIDKVYMNGKKKYAKGKLDDKTVNALGGNKIFIDIEGAVDNKEIKTE